MLMIYIAVLSVFYIKFNIFIEGRFFLITYLNILGSVFYYYLYFYGGLILYCKYN